MMFIVESYPIIFFNPFPENMIITRFSESFSSLLYRDGRYSHPCFTLFKTNHDPAIIVHSPKNNEVTKLTPPTNILLLECVNHYSLKWIRSLLQYSLRKNRLIRLQWNGFQIVTHRCRHDWNVMPNKRRFSITALLTRCYQPIAAGIILVAFLITFVYSCRPDIPRIHSFCDIKYPHWFQFIGSQPVAILTTTSMIVEPRIYHWMVFFLDHQFSSATIFGRFERDAFQTIKLILFPIL